ncbi:MAG TPA: PadR family transcriptional regulator [Vicinamibacterales bacterium]|nr:PadR family transcriptional regulator [Vicinamibacterales bacterium]
MANDRMPTVSPTESLILDLLQRDTRYGLELVEGSGGRLKRGSIYVTLGRMEAKGFVESHQEQRHPGAIGLPRRLYTATGYGLQVRDAYRLLRDALRLKPAEAQS